MNEFLLFSFGIAFGIAFVVLSVIIRQYYEKQKLLSEETIRQYIVKYLEAEHDRKTRFVKSSKVHRSKAGR